MKVSLCPKCRISPSITTTEIKCPKCGVVANGSNLAESVDNWNSEKFSTPVKPVKVVVKDIDVLKEEIQNEPPIVDIPEDAESIEVPETPDEEVVEEPVKEERKPIKKPVKKSVKKGNK